MINMNRASLILFLINLVNSDRYGYSEFETNLKVHNYDTSKSFFTNNMDWESKNMNFQSGAYGQFLAQIKKC